MGVHNPFVVALVATVVALSSAAAQLRTGHNSSSHHAHSSPNAHPH